MGELQEGQTYRVRHTRHGEFVIRVTKVSEKWITGVLVSGKPKFVLAYNNVDQGEEFTSRKSFLTVLEDGA